MKKIFFLFAVLTIFFASQVKAQSIMFGVKAGLNVSDIHFNNNIVDKENRVGWFFGPTVKFSLPVAGLGVDASLLYDYRSTMINDRTGEKLNVKHQQVAIPVNLRYSIELGSVVSMFFFAGPQWGINVGNKDFKWNNINKYSMKSSDFSVNLGLGITVLKHLEVNANYNIACGKSADVTLGSIANNIITSESHNNSWQVGVTYLF